MAMARGESEEMIAATVRVEDSAGRVNHTLHVDRFSDSPDGDVGWLKVMNAMGLGFQRAGKVALFGGFWRILNVLKLLTDALEPSGPG